VLSAKSRKRRVSLKYRNDDGVDVRTLPLIHHADQRKGGKFSAPLFSYLVARFPIK
jgi:hypothetical protein